MSSAGLSLLYSPVTGTIGNDEITVPGHTLSCQEALTEILTNQIPSQTRKLSERSRR